MAVGSDESNPTGTIPSGDHAKTRTAWLEGRKPAPAGTRTFQIKGKSLVSPRLGVVKILTSGRHGPIPKTLTIGLSILCRLRHPFLFLTCRLDYYLGCPFNIEFL